MGVKPSASSEAWFAPVPRACVSRRLGQASTQSGWRALAMPLPMLETEALAHVACLPGKQRECA
eukprot:14513095-Alexandrium_andersonii.AAC.1